MTRSVQPMAGGIQEKLSPISETALYHFQDYINTTKDMLPQARIEELRGSDPVLADIVPAILEHKDILGPLRDAVRVGYATTHKLFLLQAEAVDIDLLQSDPQRVHALLPNVITKWRPRRFLRAETSRLEIETNHSDSQETFLIQALGAVILSEIKRGVHAEAPFAMLYGGFAMRRIILEQAAVTDLEQVMRLSA